MDHKTNESESINDKSIKSDATNVKSTSAVIQTKEEYFNALRVWLQQVQLQQMAYTYFPYYLSSNLQSNVSNGLTSPMNQYSAFLPISNQRCDS